MACIPKYKNARSARTEISSASCLAPPVQQAADVDTIRLRGWESSLGLTVGVAGITKPGTIKCLHTHFAHFLATGQNLVGQWVNDALNAGLHLRHENVPSAEQNMKT